MRYTLLALVCFLMAGCQKDKYTTAPQIKFKSISPDEASTNLTINNKDAAPKLTIHITDAEGDIGFKPGKDTSKVYIKNLLTNSIDSLILPDIQLAGAKNFEADIIINLFAALECRDPGPGVPPKPRTDTIYYEVYVKDFAKNKSNVITTSKPVYYHCLH